jgi:hypothetical protein
MVICLPQRPQCRGRPSSSLTVGIEPENVDGHGGGRDLTHNPVSRANGPASERLTSSLTVARDLGKRGSAQRWAATYSHGGSHGPPSTSRRIAGQLSETVSFSDSCPVSWPPALDVSRTRVRNQRRTTNPAKGSATFPAWDTCLATPAPPTTDQQPQLQVDALQRAGCYRVFTETASGARSDRPTDPLLVRAWGSTRRRSHRRGVQPVGHEHLTRTTPSTQQAPREDARTLLICERGCSSTEASWSWLVLRWWLGVADRAGVKVERPERRVDDDLDAGEGRHRMKQRREASVTAAASPHAAWFGAWRAGVQPYLGARTRSGDMMGDRVPARGGCGRSFYGGRPGGTGRTAPRGDRSIRELAAPHQRSRSPSAHDASQFRRRLGARLPGRAPGRRARAGCGRPRGRACAPPTARRACRPGVA